MQQLLLALSEHQLFPYLKQKRKSLKLNKNKYTLQSEIFLLQKKTSSIPYGLLRTNRKANE
jgi:hypothetical protein